MSVLMSLLSSLGPLALAFSFVVMALLGRRMGEAMHARRYYLLYWAGAALCALPVVGGWFAWAAGLGGFPDLSEPASYRLASLLFLLPTCVGATLSLYATLRYWKWVWPELRAMSAAGRIERPAP
jgi:hypothetical protein